MRLPPLNKARPILAGLVVLVLLAYLVLRLTVNSLLLETVINAALTPASGGLYYVEIGDVSFSVLGGDLTARDLRLRRRHQVADSLDPNKRGPSIFLTGQLDEVSFQNVGLLRLALAQDLVAKRFSVTRPQFTVTVIERLTPAQAKARVDTAAVRSDSTLLGNLSQKEQKLISESLPYLAIGNVEIMDVNATLIAIGPYGIDRREANLQNQLRGLSVTLENFVIDPSKPRDPSRVAFSDDARIDFEHLHAELPGDQMLDIGPFSSSSRSGTLTIGSVSVIPSFSEEEYLEGAGPGGDRVELSVGPISFDGFRYRRAFEDLEFTLARGQVENLEVLIMSDKQRVRSETAAGKGRPFMPHDVFRHLPVRVTVDSLDVANASVTYSERGTKGMRPGSITISDISATVQNVSNRPARMTSATPARMHATGRLFGTARAHVSLDIPLLDPAPTMRLGARLGSFDPREVNAILPALEGMRVTEGQVDSAWLDIDYGSTMATGSLVAIYRDLGVRLEDRDTGDQSIGQKILSFGAKVGLRGSNDPDPGKEPNAGKVEYEIVPEKPFFAVFWEAIRQGLVDLVMKL